jgi:hypothetical protein
VTVKKVRRKAIRSVVANEICNGNDVLVVNKSFIRGRSHRSLKIHEEKYRREEEKISDDCEKWKNVGKRKPKKKVLVE